MISVAIRSRFIVFCFLFLATAGCTICDTKRGHLIRCEWAIEHNRVPWIGCPPTSGTNDDGDTEIDDGRSCGLLKGKSRQKGFRWHCGRSPDCTAKNPCCKTLGCGMWIDPNNPASMTQLGGGAKACGLTPFCTSANPCGLTPNCGKPVPLRFNPAVNPAVLQGNNVPATQHSGMLVSKGIVPGISAVTTGGTVAAIGVATPAGTMTPSGVRLPNGAVDTNLAIRACLLSPNCTATHPCGLVPGCGTAVPLTMVSNNATVLAAALMTQGASSGAAQIGTMVNPVTNQPYPGLTMSGNPQTGYPPIGYAPTGYAPGYPRFAGGETAVPAPQDEEPTAEATVERQSKMPVPRFYPVPSKPAFQRSEGLQPVKRTVSLAEPPDEFNMALDEAYLEGVSAAMDEVERELALQRQAEKKRMLQAKIAQQTRAMQKMTAVTVVDGGFEPEQSSAEPLPVKAGKQQLAVERVNDGRKMTNDGLAGMLKSVFSSKTNPDSKQNTISKTHNNTKPETRNTKQLAVNSVPPKPAVIEKNQKTPQFALEPETVNLVQQARYERELPRP